MMSGYSSAWFDASQVNMAAAAAASSRSHQLYAAVAEEDCLRPAVAPVASCRSLPHHGRRYDVKQLQETALTGVTHLLPADMSAYSDDRYSMYGSYCAYSSCSPPPRAAALSVHGHLAGSGSVFDVQRDCTDAELTQHVDGVTDIASQHLANSDNGQNLTTLVFYKQQDVRPR